MTVHVSDVAAVCSDGAHRAESQFVPTVNRTPQTESVMLKLKNRLISGRELSLRFCACDSFQSADRSLCCSRIIHGGDAADRTGAQPLLEENVDAPPPLQSFLRFSFHFASLKTCLRCLYYGGLQVILCEVASEPDAAAGPTVETLDETLTITDRRWSRCLFIQKLRVIFYGIISRKGQKLRLQIHRKQSDNNMFQWLRG